MPYGCPIRDHTIETLRMAIDWAEDKVNDPMSFRLTDLKIMRYALGNLNAFWETLASLHERPFKNWKPA